MNTWRENMVTLKRLSFLEVQLINELLITTWQLNLTEPWCNDSHRLWDYFCAGDSMTLVFWLLLCAEAFCFFNLAIFRGQKIKVPDLISASFEILFWPKLEWNTKWLLASLLLNYQHILLKRTALIVTMFFLKKKSDVVWFDWMSLN